MQFSFAEREAGRIAKSKEPFQKSIEDEAVSFSIEVKDDKIEVFEKGYVHETNETKSKSKMAQTDGHGVKTSKNASTEMKKHNMKSKSTQTDASTKKVDRVGRVGRGIFRIVLKL